MGRGLYCCQQHVNAGIVNFYRKFIEKYSTIEAPLNHLTSTKRRFDWYPAAGPSQPWKNGSPWLQFWLCLTPQYSLSLTLGSVLFFHNGRLVTINSVVVLSSTHGCHLQRGITTLATESCWRLSWPWRNGVICWRGQNHYSRCGQTIRTWSASAWLRDSIPERSGGLCFSVGFTSPLLTDPAPRIGNLSH